MLVDLYLDPQTRDLWVDIDGSARLTTDIPEAAAQRLTVTLMMFLGEWFLDVTKGVPYFDVFKTRLPLDGVRALFRRTIQSDSYVVDVPRVSLSLDGATRALSLEFDARLREGSLLGVAAVIGLVNGALVVQGIQIVVNGVPVVVS